MNTPKHTPGLWHVGLRPGPMVYGPQGEQIVGLNVMLDSDEVLANAKFIAAAPAMYALLQDATLQLSRLTGSNLEAYARTFAVLAQKALAQAEGGGHE